MFYHILLIILDLIFEFNFKNNNDKIVIHVIFNSVFYEKTKHMQDKIQDESIIPEYVGSKQ